MKYNVLFCSNIRVLHLINGKKESETDNSPSNVMSTVNEIDNSLPLEMSDGKKRIGTTTTTANGFNNTTNCLSKTKRVSERTKSPCWTHIYRSSAKSAGVCLYAATSIGLLTNMPTQLLFTIFKHVIGYQVDECGVAWCVHGTQFIRSSV